jgi:hypothetical protein
MIDDERVAQWAAEASVALMRNLDKHAESARMAAIVAALIADRRERESYIREQN